MRLFIAHASEDKGEIARPLAEGLTTVGFDVWYDEFSLRLGDSLSREIDRGLSQCDYGVVILSRGFFSKNWPRKELDALVAREAYEGASVKIVLPVWHSINHREVIEFSPTLADRFAVSTSNGIPAVVEAIVKAVRPTPGVPSPWGSRGELRQAPLDPREILSKIIHKGPDLPSEGLSDDGIRLLHELVEQWQKNGRLILMVEADLLTPDRRKVLFNEEKMVFLIASHGMFKVWFEAVDLTYRTIDIVRHYGREDPMDFNEALEFFLTEMGFLGQDLLKATVTPIINMDNLFWVTIPFPLGMS